MCGNIDGLHRNIIQYDVSALRYMARDYLRFYQYFELVTPTPLLVAEFLLAFCLNCTIHFAVAFPENYEPPPGGFYFEVHDNSPIV
jgi:hypothetical protein